MLGPGKPPSQVEPDSRLLALLCLTLTTPSGSCSCVTVRARLWLPWDGAPAPGGGGWLLETRVLEPGFGGGLGP